MLGEQCGKPIEQPNHCQILALDIESKTGEHVGVNTIKRLLGFIDDEREPRITTLNIIALYLGYEDWNALKLLDNKKGNSGFDETQTEIHAAQLELGTMIEITYLPNRKLVVKYLGDSSFVVVESINGKLCVGDLLALDYIVCDYPLLVSEVMREGKSLGSFTAGKQQGIKFNIL